MADKFTDADLWSELDSYFKVEQKRPGDVTITDAAEHYGVSDETARVRLNQLVKDGIYARVSVMVNGRMAKAYRKVQADA